MDDEDVGKDEEDPNYFPIKLAYNKVHHYLPIVPENIFIYLEAYNNATYFTRQARESLKSFRNTLPIESNYYKLVDCAYTAAINTTTVLSGCNIISGTTGTAGATSAAEVFNFPSVESASSKKKRKTAVAPAAPLPTLSSAPGSSTQFQVQPVEQEEPLEQEEEHEDIQFRLPDKDDSPAITIPHKGELKHGPHQCFCGKGDLQTEGDMQKHLEDKHVSKGKGTNPKTKKRNDLWACSVCNKVCNDKRAVWKHYRTMHCNVFIHYCPVPGCSTGNDQKDSIVAHIIKEHKNEEEWVDKAYRQQWLTCPTCLKFFMSVKGRNAHVPQCGKPKMRINCPYEFCHKTYKAEERLDQHIDTAHKGQAHKCLCPYCGNPFGSKQSLDNHIKNEHN